MTKAKRVHSTPRKTASKKVRGIRQLRVAARDEIERLIDFLDASDPYASTELEDECEDEGAEHDGREPGEDEEPSLGWTADGCLGDCTELDLEAGEGARRPQGGTTVPPAACIKTAERTGVGSRVRLKTGDGRTLITV